MADIELEDSADALQARETAHAVPLGVKLLFAGLIAWGIYYLYAYSPWTTGWTQEADLQGAPATSVNIAHTIAYTAIPALVALVLGVSMARRKKAAKK
jgi:heme/copper-type cytochrome/quinol oxidase subunit 2